MGLYERIANERRGEKALRDEEAEIRGQAIAEQQIARTSEIEARNEAQRFNEVAGQAQAFDQGVETERVNSLNSMRDPEQSGLMMGSDTIESMQQQQNTEEQMRIDIATQTLDQLEAMEVQIKNAPPEQQEQMMMQLQEAVQNIPPEIQGTMEQIEQQREVSFTNQGEQPLENNTTGRTGRPVSPVTEYATKLLQQE